MASLDSATEQIKQLTLDIGVAEEMRNASLTSASAEAQDYAKLRGRLTELEGQLNMSREETDSIAAKLESTIALLSEANEKLASSESRLKELDAALASARSEIVGLETTRIEASAISSSNIAHLEARLATAIKGGEDRIASLQAEIDGILVERNQARSDISSLQACISEHEGDKEQRGQKISELESNSIILAQRISALESELESSKTQYHELVQSSTSNEAASNAKLTALREETTADAQKAATRIAQLEAEIIIITERCTHHTAELTEAQASVKELESTRTTLVETTERITDLEDQLLEAEGRAGGFDAQLSEAQDKIHEYEARQLTHSDVIESLKKEHISALAEYEGRLSEMTSGAVTNASRHAALENEVSALINKVSGLDGDLSSARSENEVLVTRFATVDSDLASVKTENDGLKAKLSALNDDLTAAKTQSDSLKADFEERSKVAEDAHASALAAADARTKELEERLNAAEEAQKLLEKQLADAEQSTSTTQLQSTESHILLETSLKEAEEKCTALQNDVEEKSALLGELELKILAVTDLEAKLQLLEKDQEDITARAAREKGELQAQMATLNVQIVDNQQREADVSFRLQVNGTTN